MTSRNTQPHPRRLALALALLALLAQLWMGQVSATHLAQMVAAQGLWGSDICTTQTNAHSADAPADPQRNNPAASPLGCPVGCTAAASFTPGGAPPVVAAVQAQALYRASFASIPAPQRPHASVRPPAQAPPAA